MKTIIEFHYHEICRCWLGHPAVVVVWPAGGGSVVVWGKDQPRKDQPRQPGRARQPRRLTSMWFVWSGQTDSLGLSR